jgi:acyltransferase
MMVKERINWIDAGKGLGILAVVLGHISYKNKILKQYIFSFHMPLFFFMSGYLFDREKFNGYRCFVSRKIKSLLIPYFIFSFLSYLYWITVERQYRPENLDISIIKPLIGIFYSNAIDDWMVQNTALWFITCLFVVENAFYFLSYIKSKKMLALVLLIFSAAGYLDSLYMPVRLPWGIDVALSALPFYGAGYIMKYNSKKIKDIIKPVPVLYIMPVLFSLNYIFSRLNSKVDMNLNLLGNYFLFYAGALTGIGAYILLSRKLTRVNLISYIGKNSIIVLAMHEPVKRLVLGIVMLIFDVSYDALRTSIMFGIPLTIFTISIILPFVYVINKRFTLLIGRKHRALEQ